MSGLSQNRPPMSTRPWFAAIAMTIGMSAMAFGAYTVENPHAFTSKIVPEAPSQAQVDVVRKVDLAPTPDQSKASPLVIDEVVITAKARHRLPQKTLRVDPCAPNWRSLATGPAARQVREFCPTPSDGPVHPMPSTHPNAGAAQYLAPPRTQHDRLGTSDEPTQRDSLSNLLPTST